MSALVWFLWGVLTAVNLILWVACWRNLEASRDLLDEAQSLIDGDAS